MLLWLTTFAFSFVSAMVPFLPIEIYILGAATEADTTVEAWAFGFAAGAGATVGKILWYEAARRSIDSPWVQKKLMKPKTRAAFERWTARMEGRPVFSVGIMFVSAAAGVPPLLAMAAVAGLLKMPRWLYIPTVLAGRTLRFGLLFLGVDFALH